MTTRRPPRSTVLTALALMAITTPARAQEVSHFKDDLYPSFLKQIPGILKTQDKATGRFGTKPFIVTDQNVLWPLAVAWSLDRPDNPYYHDEKLLDAIMAGGDALVAAQDPVGMFEFRKKDNSTWGQIYMPWTYSRWIRAWSIVRDAMPSDRREKWDKALTLAVDGMVKTELVKPIQNIPAYNATGVYLAAQVLHRDDWKKAAVDYLHRTADAQDPGGFWTEHFGPVINYNFVYVDVMGLYYGMSKDPYVLPMLDRASKYHAHFTYPDGTNVETIDERNPYERNLAAGGLGFTFTPEGRGYEQHLLDIRRKLHIQPLADASASILYYGEDGPITPPPGDKPHDRFVLGHDDAETVRDAPWFACLSAYHCTPGTARWIQDRQAFLSVFHDRTGLILTGGNTKLQPLWSTFTAGDVKLLYHKPGDENPNFTCPPGLVHIPSSITLHPGDNALDLTYGNAHCFAKLDFDSPTEAVATYELKSSSDLPVEAHAAFLPHVGEQWQTARAEGKLDAAPFAFTSEQCGGTFAHHGWRITVPPGATIQWPVYPHNPYTKDGSATPWEARIVVTLPLGTAPAKQRLRIDIPDTNAATKP